MIFKITTALNTTTPPQPPTGNIPLPIPAGTAPDVANAAELRTALDALQGDWDGTMAGWGLSKTEVPVITVTGGPHTENFSISNYDFSANPGVSIRGTGTFTRDDWLPIGCTQFSRLMVTNCHNIDLWALHFQPVSLSGGFNDQQHYLDNCTDVNLGRCLVYGDPARDATAAAVGCPDSVVHMFDPRSTTDCGLFYCTVAGGQARLIGGAGRDNLRFTIWGCTFDQSGGDCIQISSTPAGKDSIDWNISHCLGPGVQRSPGGTHCDFVQVFSNGATANAVGWTFEHNVLKTCGWYGNKSFRAFQGFWFDGTNDSRAIIRDNIAQIEHGLVTGAHSLATIENNGGFLNIDPRNDDGSQPFSAGYAYMDHAGNGKENITISNWAGQRPAGTNGVEIVCGNSAGSEDPSADWGPMLAEFENANDQGAVSTWRPSRDNGSLADFKPAVGGRYHWDNPSKIGPWQNAQRMFGDSADADHWGLWGWPVAAHCHLRFAADNSLTDMSGTYHDFNDAGEYTG